MVHSVQISEGGTCAFDASSLSDLALFAFSARDLIRRFAKYARRKQRAIGAARLPGVAGCHQSATASVGVVTGKDFVARTVEAFLHAKTILEKAVKLPTWLEKSPVWLRVDHINLVKYL